MSTTYEEIQIKVCPPHKIVRSKSNHEVFRCIHPKCSYYQRREFIEGRECICSSCDRLYIVDAQQLRNSKPRCAFCQDTKKAKAYREMLEKIPPTVEEEKI